jgi:hypothetical protein
LSNRTRTQDAIESQKRRIRSRDGCALCLSTGERLQRQQIRSSLEKGAFYNSGEHLERSIEWNSTQSIINIGQSKFEMLGFTFVGYEFTDYEKTQEQQTDDMPQIESLMNGKTILVTHAPPYGVLDTVMLKGASTGAQHLHVGSKALVRLKEKGPLLHLFGHVHNAFGIQGRSVNGSYDPIMRVISIFDGRWIVLREGQHNLLVLKAH